MKHILVVLVISLTSCLCPCPVIPTKCYFSCHRHEECVGLNTTGCTGRCDLFNFKCEGCTCPPPDGGTDGWLPKGPPDLEIPHDLQEGQ